MNFVKMPRVAKKPQYQAFNDRPNCFGRFQNHPHQLVDWWQPDYRLMLEVGAGQAEVSVYFATKNPDWQVLALDKKSDRLGKAARDCRLSNLAFLQTDLDQLPDFLDLSQNVDLIWLAFPDPFNRTRQAKHRLTAPRRLQILSQLLKPGGRLRLKTDNDQFLSDTCQALTKGAWQITALNYDLESGTMSDSDVLTITTYEQRFRQAGQTIKYLEARPTHLRV